MCSWPAGGTTQGAEPSCLGTRTVTVRGSAGNGRDQRGIQENMHLTRLVLAAATATIISNAAASCSDHSSCSYCNSDTFGCGLGWAWTCYCQWTGSYCSDADTSNDATYEHACAASGSNPWNDDLSGTCPKPGGGTTRHGGATYLVRAHTHDTDPQQSIGIPQQLVH